MTRLSFSRGAALAAVAVLVAPAALFAQEHGAKKSVLEPDIINSITTVVVFGLLVLILRAFAWKPILEGLHKREENIRSALEAAQQAKADAESVEAEFRKKMAEVGEQSRRLVDEARQSAQKLKDEFLTQAKAELAQDRHRLQREIETARDQALQDLWKQSVELATLISTKAVRRALSSEDHARLVDEALAELRERQQTAAAGGMV
jgi:F-type H+-transporting ATPase subunit b